MNKKILILVIIILLLSLILYVRIVKTKNDIDIYNASEQASEQAVESSKNISQGALDAAKKTEDSLKQMMND